MAEPQQTVVQDLKAYTIGVGSMVGFSLADLSTVAQQIGVVFGALVVVVTFLHRFLLFWRDLKK